MTERCQTKFTENIDNFNYIIYFGILCTSVAVLLFYRFHFATIAFSYGLGCLACYYGVNSSILLDYVEKLKCHFLGQSAERRELEDAPKKRCSACGSKECARHDTGVSSEPWVGLQIHKQLDQAIEDFYNTILEQFISSWYSKITLQPFFVDELRHQLRYASANLLQRAIKINYSQFLTRRIIPCALRHYWTCIDVRRDATPLGVHVAARSRTSELDYLRCLSERLMPIVLRDSEISNPVFKVLIREIFSGWALLSLTDVLSDPFALNTLIVLATGVETMVPLPTTPNYKVEFLETFARQTDSVYLQRCKLMKIELDLVMSDQEYFYSFMQYLKTTTHIFLLQFYKDIKSFQTKLLNPDLSASEMTSLHKEACDIYDTYLREDSASRVPLQASISEELHELLLAGDSVKRLQTSRALYQAARQSHAVLEKILLPKFLHSEEFYKLLIGSRIPPGYQKNMTKKPHERLLASAVKLTSKLKSALKGNIDGQLLESLSSDDAELENVDLLKYLDSVAADETHGHDLSTYKVVITNVETRLQVPPRRGTVRVFTLAVHRAEPGAAASLWSVARSEHDFHLMRSKLHEFHGDALLQHLPLPSRRDNSPLETLRYKYEDFLQRLLQKRLLQTSEMLRIFLTDDGDFSLVIQASTLNANSTDLVNIYQNVTHKLRKEKGQHLESFMTNLLVSTDMERYQALKHGNHVEEAMEVSEELPPSHRGQHKRDIRREPFGNNLDVEDRAVLVLGAQTRHQDCVVGFTHCFMYLLTNIIRARSFVVHILGTVLGFTRDLVDEAFNKFLNRALCDVVSERRLAHLIRLGHAVLFGKKTHSKHDPARQRETARAQLLARVPRSASALLGPGLRAAVLAAFEMVQQPHLNKQLVYNLLDLCVVELFPELNSESEIPSR